MTEHRLFDPGPPSVMHGPPKPPSPDFELKVEFKQRLVVDIPRFLDNRLDEYLDWDDPDNYMSSPSPADRILSFLIWSVEQDADTPYFWTADRTIKEQFFADLEIDYRRGIDEERAIEIHHSLGLTADGTSRSHNVKRPVWF